MLGSEGAVYYAGEARLTRDNDLVQAPAELARTTERPGCDPRPRSDIAPHATRSAGAALGDNSAEPAMTSPEERPTEPVRTAQGGVRGVERDGLRCFLGIPYAAPPCGDLRWRPPQPHAGWSAPLEAVAFGAVCAQSSAGRPGFAYDSETEDCLFLNVFAPGGARDGDKRPVMVWFPGGGLFMGGANGYDPGALVAEGVVCVTLNYRLNVFGFFSHPAVNAEGHPAGNYGLMDQQAALGWVRQNIAGFGGDPGNVTIFGESAGGICVWTHLASPGSRGLFHKAIIMSGTGTPLLQTPSLHRREEVGLALAAEAGCTDRGAAGLRALSTKDLLRINAPAPGGFAASGRFNVGLMADGDTVPEPMHELFTTGRFAHVPVINGTTRDEFTWFLAMRELATGQVVTAARYPEALAASLASALPQLLNVHIEPAALPGILERYPAERFPTPSNALAAAIGDCGLVCNGGRRASRTVKRYVDAVWAYEFDVADSPIPWPPASFPYQSAHTVELAYIFPGFRGASGTQHALNGAQQTLARQMVRYFTSFARTGAPGAGPQAPAWPAYDPAKDNYLSLRTPAPVVLEAFGDRHHCDFWDGLSA